MSLELCIAASGSTGNCALVRTPAGVALIDAGLGPKLLAQRLTGTGVTLAGIGAICLTHLDIDHFSPGWVPVIVQRKLPVFCHQTCVAELAEIFAEPAAEPMIRSFDGDRFDLLPGLSALPIQLAHDQEGSCGFVLESARGRIGYATDLGHVPARLIEAFADLDVLALESNYDPEMQENSPRHPSLKKRITGGRGHLSNAQTLAAIREILDRTERRGGALPEHIVLLHRSRQCNCPRLLRKMFEADARIASRLVLAEAYHRSEWLSAPGRPIAPGEQLLLAWG